MEVAGEESHPLHASQVKAFDINDHSALFVQSW